MSKNILLTKKWQRLVLSIFFCIPLGSAIAQKHPQLILTKKGVEEIRTQLGTIPIFDSTLAQTKKEIDAEITLGIQVPIPKDMAGGYTHDRHKKNFFTLQKAGVLFQISKDPKYLNYVHDMFKEYAKMYKGLPLHPQKRSYARGKIFWQCLNDSNWLVYASQAYDCIYDHISKKERDYLEAELFIPFADFLSIETPQFFNRVHNHSTWGNVAVGMIGLVMNNQELIDRALYGLKTDTIDPNQKDNDGGFIKKVGQKTGFLANLDEPFSPDGYYTEGPYYQRYAMYPFMIFAEALENVKPELKIFEYKGGVLLKAVNALLNLTDTKGEFFPLNDGQKGMSYYTPALVSAVDIAYYFGKQDPTLLSIAKKQETVQLDDTGLAVAMGIQNHLEKPFLKKSMELRDGPNGFQGAVGILRSSDSSANQISLVYKYTAHGSSHGHYDKLSYSYYKGGEEILQDYGLARFVNIEQKNGGGYLKENKTWAKQSIAHNTIIQDTTSHFEGKFKIGSTHHSEKQVFDVSNPKQQIVSAKEENAYPGTKLQRTLLLLEDIEFTNPFLLDIMQFQAEATHQYDLPYYYIGQIIDTNFKYSQSDAMNALGTKHGYQHLRKEASVTIEKDGLNQVTWMNNNSFYTLSTLLKVNDEFMFTRIGANDPEFNLRRDPGFLIRKPKTASGAFISIIETHGSYDFVTEIATDSASNIKNIQQLNMEQKGYLGVEIQTKKETTFKIFIAINVSEKEKKHKVKYNGKVLKWIGPYFIQKTN